MAAVCNICITAEQGTRGGLSVVTENKRLMRLFSGELPVNRLLAFVTRGCLLPGNTPGYVYRSAFIKTFIIVCSPVGGGGMWQ